MKCNRETVISVVVTLGPCTIHLNRLRQYCQWNRNENSILTMMMMMMTIKLMTETSKVVSVDVDSAVVVVVVVVVVVADVLVELLDYHPATDGTREDDNSLDEIHSTQ
jgi:hypothetical protein